MFEVISVCRADIRLPPLQIKNPASRARRKNDRNATTACGFTSRIRREVEIEAISEAVLVKSYDNCSSIAAKNCDRES
jgi:hypothetical protein